MQSWMAEGWSEPTPTKPGAVHASSAKPNRPVAAKARHITTKLPFLRIRIRTSGTALGSLFDFDCAYDSIYVGGSSNFDIEGELFWSRDPSRLTLPTCPPRDPLGCAIDHQALHVGWYVARTERGRLLGEGSASQPGP